MDLGSGSARYRAARVSVTQNYFIVGLSLKARYIRNRTKSKDIMNLGLQYLCEIV
jgi:hypothetical protein